jgi:hypothetical protein
VRRKRLEVGEGPNERKGAGAAGVPKAPLIPASVAQREGDGGPHVDSVDALVGSLDIEPTDVDDVVYGAS